MKKQKRNDSPFILAMVGYVLNAILLLGVTLGIVGLAFGVKNELDLAAGLIIFLIMVGTIGTTVGAGILGLSIAAIIKSGSVYKEHKEEQQRVVMLGVGNLVLMGGLVMLLFVLTGILLVGGYYMPNVRAFAQGYSLMQVIGVVIGLMGLMILVCRNK